MPVAMTDTEREAVLDTLIMNEQSCQLSNAVEGLRDAGECEIAAKSLIEYADHFSIQVRQRVREIIHKHPEGHAAILSLLRTVLTWVDKDRAELQSTKFSGLRIAPSSDAAQLRDLDSFERFVRDMAKDILRANLQKNGMVR